MVTFPNLLNNIVIRCNRNIVKLIGMEIKYDYSIFIIICYYFHFINNFYNQLTEEKTKQK